VGPRASHQNARQNPSTTPNKFFENMAQFKYLATVTNQNYIHEAVKGRLNLRSVCYLSVQNLLSSHLPLKTVKIITYKTIILSVVVWV
jgi:hypothetical protein